MTESHARPKLFVGIATGGRPAVLAEILRELERQTVRPDCVMICHGAPADVEGIDPAPDRMLLVGPQSAAEKRNVILEHAGDADFMLFMDDDFLPEPHYIERTWQVMQAQPDVAVATGHVIADGSIGPGYTVAEGRSFLQSDDFDGNSSVTPAPHGYGCNITVRLQVGREHGIRFDEQLPLYSYFEDLDYTRRLGRHGRIVKISGARGVHLATKSGRVSGYRMGYTQMVNVVYLMRKGTMPWPRGINVLGRHFGNNFLRSFNPESFIDRRGRFLGNLRGAYDILRGRVDPARVLLLK